jgi:hypothetical protein
MNMKTIIALLSVLMLSMPAFSATQEEDVATYLKVFESNFDAHAHAVEQLAWKGLSDPRLFDVIEFRLFSDLAAAERNRRVANRVAHYIRALGFSGQAKYKPSIERFVGHEYYGRHAITALDDLPRYERWNPVISDRNTFDPKYSDDVNRVMNMLRSSDVLLQRVGAKRVYFGTNDPYLLNYLQRLVEANNARLDYASKDLRGTQAWMVKALKKHE